MGDHVLDFYCSELDLAIEIDGLAHDLTEERDAARQARLESLGIRFIRVSAEDVERDREAVVNYIRAQARNLPSPAHGRGMSFEEGLGEGPP
jgi:very-short-patch-repair endonuclease